MIPVLSIILIVIGCGFFAVGTLGLLRLPDLFSRLHALTKADNLGLGFVAIGLALQASSPIVAAKLILVWAVAMLSAATVGQLIAIHGQRRRKITGDRANGDWE